MMIGIVLCKNVDYRDINLAFMPILCD